MKTNNVDVIASIRIYIVAILSILLSIAFFKDGLSNAIYYFSFEVIGNRFSSILLFIHILLLVVAYSITSIYLYKHKYKNSDELSRILTVVIIIGLIIITTSGIASLLLKVDLLGFITSVSTTVVVRTLFSLGIGTFFFGIVLKLGFFSVF